MELSTGAKVEETSPLRVQEIEIRHTKQFALLSWSRNTSGEKTVKFFLGGCWCALPVWPEISSPQGEVRVVTDEAIRSRDTSLALSGPQLLSEISTQLPLWAMKAEGQIFSLLWPPWVYLKKAFTAQAQALSAATREWINESWPGHDRCVLELQTEGQEKAKFQLQAQREWSSLYEAMHGLVNQTSSFIFMKELNQFQ